MCLFAGVPANAILEMFGKMFFEFCQESGYDKILQVLGANVRDFLQVFIFKQINKYLYCFFLFLIVIKFIY